MTALTTNRKIKKHEPCHCYICMGDRYWTPCVGCKDGHSSFWKTVTESPQWESWRKYAWEDKMLYDFPEVEELGIISEAHFQEFIKFCKKIK